MFPRRASWAACVCIAGLVLGCSSSEHSDLFSTPGGGSGGAHDGGAGGAATGSGSTGSGTTTASSTTASGSGTSGATTGSGGGGAGGSGGVGMTGGAGGATGGASAGGAGPGGTAGSPAGSGGASSGGAGGATSAGGAGGATSSGGAGGATSAGGAGGAGGTGTAGSAGSGNAGSGGSGSGGAGGAAGSANTGGAGGGGLGGAAGAGGGPPGDVGDACAANEGCKQGLYCKKAGCGAIGVLGRCASRPEQCAFEDGPICGCDGITYLSACLAEMNGQNTYGQPGICKDGVALKCTPGDKTCDIRPNGVCGVIVAEHGACPSAVVPGKCWVIPDECSPTGTHYDSCDGSGKCVHTCDVVKDEKPYYPAPDINCQ